MLLQSLLVVHLLAGFTVASAMQTDAYDAGYYTSTRVGDTVVVPEDDTTDLYLMVFASSNSCFTCTESVRPIQQIIARLGCTTVTMYVRSADKALPVRLREQHGWDFDIVLDPLGAYQKLYGIKNSPLGIVADRHGVVRAVGTIGTSTYDWNAEVKKIRVTKEQRRTARPFREVVLDSSAVFGAGGLQRQAIFLNDTVFAVQSLALGRIAIFTTSGKRIAYRASLKSNDYTPFIPLAAHSPEGVHALLLVDEDPVTGQRVLVWLNESLEQIRVMRPTLDMRAGGSPTFMYSTNRAMTQLAASVAFRDSISRQSNNVSSTVWDIATGKRLHEFPIGVHYRMADLSNFYWTSVVISDSEVASVCNLDDKLHIIRVTQDESVADVPIAYDRTSWRDAWRYTYTDVSWDTPLEVRKSFGKNTSSMDHLMRDESTGEYYLAYTNKGELDVVRSYVVGPIGSTNCRTVSIGVDVLSHRVHNGVLYGTIIKEGMLRLVTFHIQID